MSISLVSVYDDPQLSIPYLLEMLSVRPKYVNISHKRMPTMPEHIKFFESRPYEAWYLILSEGTKVVGVIYLSRQREVGVQIELGHQRKGYARQAIARLRELHPGRILANVAPHNGPSHSLFKKLGGKVIQYTYEL